MLTVDGMEILGNRTNAGPWRLLAVTGGRGTTIVDNLLGGHPDVDPIPTHQAVHPKSRSA
ncbi:MAG: hypothetical protein HQ582_15045 [Planctomycetes bacterium]|nr:hypothetical protein [Planctomycetota bacterium]